MKTMTCRQMGGACEQKFSANSFDEISELSKEHGIEMFQKADKPHFRAMARMKELMKTSGSMTGWLNSKRREFDALPEDE
ncbi:DUF1059 domain-containing protein [Christiangramia salexigens]|uniref:DUF1059 domain-containing protein n=1 Tax=Christiangramia salexigens TaxID=1913577 RepID=A0A1L3J459_9FLAO|nr:DUF1059 domain-containing protein [Christiangramia salexigens]APG59894.1 DUF1059 domain-containing protein [Christiangramia salexigens]